MPKFSWTGKDDVLNHHQNVEYQTIECKETIGDSKTENLIIEGDNLLALKSLIPYYANSIKMVYIDPPYNTGNTSWVYNDNVNSPTIQKWLGKNVDKEDLNRSDKWLNMMYPRLKLLHKLLKEDGVIFISIDDNEVAHLRILCDEIFGEDNFVTSISWQSRTSKQNDTDISANHEYILVYAKNRKQKDRRLKESNKNEWYNSNQFAFYPIETDKSRYSNPDNDSRGLWKADPFDAPNIRPNLTYPIKNKNTDKIYMPPKGRCWRTEESKFYELLKDNRIIFGKDGTAKPQLKVFYNEKVEFGEVETTWWNGNERGTTTEGVKEIIQLFNKKLFDTPKPVKLLRNLLKIATSKNDIILDSFAGSGTTAQAVLEQNQKDNGNRKFILIEMEKHIAKPITAERVKRVISGYEFKGKVKTELFNKKLTSSQILNSKTMTKISDEVSEIIQSQKDNFSKIEKKFENNTISINGIQEVSKFKDGIGGGFKFCQLGKTLFNELGELNSEISDSVLAKHIHFLEFKQPLKKYKKGHFVGEYKNRFLYLFLNKRFTLSELNSILLTLNDYSEIVIYTNRSIISEDYQKEYNVSIRYLPNDIQGR